MVAENIQPLTDEASIDAAFASFKATMVATASSWPEETATDVIVIGAQATEADRLKKLLISKPRSLEKELLNYQNTLDAVAQLAKALQDYKECKPKFDEMGIEPELEAHCEQAYQQTLAEHQDLARILLHSDNSPNNTSDILATAARVNHLTAYVTNPSDPKPLSIVIKDIDNLDKMKNTSNIKRIAGGLLKLVGYGMMALSVVIGVGSAISLFAFTPAGIAGFAVTIGLSVAGEGLRRLGVYLSNTPEAQKKIMDTRHSIGLFTNPMKNESEATPFLPKPTSVDSAALKPIPPLNPPLPAPTASNIIPNIPPAPPVPNQPGSPMVKQEKPHLLQAVHLKKIEAVLVNTAWKIDKAETDGSQKFREVTNATNGVERKFIIGEHGIKTYDADVETYKMMLACVKSTSDDLPTISTSSDELKAKWMQAFKETYPNKKEEEFKTQITVTEPVLDVADDIPAAPRP